MRSYLKQPISISEQPDVMVRCHVVFWYDIHQTYVLQPYLQILGQQNIHMSPGITILYVVTYQVHIIFKILSL